MVFIKRFLIISVFFGCAAVAVFIFYSNSQIEQVSKEHIFDQPESVPKTQVAVLLGIKKNVYYKASINAAAKLFVDDKVKAIIVSGDFSRKSYDEPNSMKSDLVALGIPEKFIVCDYVGFRTLDSIIHTDKIYGQSRFVLLSTQSQIERAVYIARKLGYTAFGLVTSQDNASLSIKDKVRELLARCKAVLDIWLKTQPKYLGNPVTLELNN